MAKYVLYTIIIALFIGCQDTAEDVYPLPDDGKIRVNVITPKLVTRAVTEAMPENSTIRLYVYDTSTWGTSPVLVDEKTYRVKEDGTTVLCKVDTLTGKSLGDVDEEAMHLPAGMYNFYSISPAIKLDRKTTQGVPAILMDHGSKLSLRTSKRESVQVDYFSAEVTGGTPGIFNLRFDPHTLLTSKLSFKVIKGDLIGDIEFVDTEMLTGKPGPQSIVIDSLPPSPYGSYNFKLGDSRITQLLTSGGRSFLGFTEEEITKNTAANPDYLFSFETEVLPCRLLDANGAPIQGGVTEDDLGNYPGSQLEERVVRICLHMNVAENRPGAIMNYKMFVVHLPKQAFQRGKNYNYTLKVDLRGILVSSWDTSSDWETVIN